MKQIIEEKWLQCQGQAREQAKISIALIAMSTCIYQSFFCPPYLISFLSDV